MIYEFMNNPLWDTWIRLIHLEIELVASQVGVFSYFMNPANKGNGNTSHPMRRVGDRKVKPEKQSFISRLIFVEITSVLMTVMIFSVMRSLGKIDIDFISQFSYMNEFIFCLAVLACTLGFKKVKDLGVDLFSLWRGGRR
jgi:hypothetical protein